MVKFVGNTNNVSSPNLIPSLYTVIKTKFQWAHFFSQAEIQSRPALSRESIPGQKESLYNDYIKISESTTDGKQSRM